MNTAENLKEYTCDCGDVLATDLSKSPGAIGQPDENHFVWAVRSDGTRSNLGYCPWKQGMQTAMRKARTILMTGFCEYQGERY